MEKGELKLEEQEAEETMPLVRKSRNGDESKISAICDVDGEVINGVSDSNGHRIQLEIAQNEEVPKIEESDGFLENEPESINGENKIEESENTSDFINGEQKFEESDGILENESKPTNGEHKIESESINGEQKLKESDRVLEIEPKTINGEQKIKESDRLLEIDSDPINAEQKKPENLVFHDKVEGIWKCRICPWTYGNGGFCVDFIQNHREQLHNMMHIKTLNFEHEGANSASKYIGVEQILKGPIKIDAPSLDFVAQNNSSSEINDKYEQEIKENGNSSSSQEGGTSYEPSKEIERLINADDLEITELDVERVIRKQTTHDLFCPNCQSCITKRVILRKRKRGTRIPDEDAKRNRLFTAVGPELDTVSTEPVQVYQEGEVGSSDVITPITDPDEHDRETDLFRCLSCFSFFIPTGDGFKLFKTNWFTKMFVPNKQETSVEDGISSSTNVPQAYTVTPSSSSSHQSVQPSVLEDSGPPSIVSQEIEGTKGIVATHEDIDAALTFSKLKPYVNRDAAIGVGGKLDMKEPEALDIQHSDVFTANQLTESKSTQTYRDYDISTSLPMKIPVTNGESAEYGISFPQQDGLKMLIASKGPQLIKSPDEGPKPNQIVQTPDKEAIEPSPPPVSVVKASDVDGMLNISVSIPHEEQGVTATIVTTSIEGNNVDSKSSDSGEAYSAEVPQQRITETKIEVHQGEQIKTEFSSTVSDAPVGQGNDAVITIDTHSAISSHIAEGIIPAATANASLTETLISSGDRERNEVGEERKKIEVIKSIVYGGLAESITSLSVVSSAAGGGAATLNVLALGAANLIGGLFVISHNLWDLKCDRDDQVSNQITEQKDRYREILGRRQNFMLHVVVAIISYLIFGLVAPVVYGFTFRDSDDRQLKLVVATVTSLVCILMLAIGKAYVQRNPKPYLKTITTFIVLGFMVSGVSYVAGNLVERLLENLGLFEATSEAPSLLLQKMNPVGSRWASY